jgi:alkylation response protein AidB-like acyl-CoA dehydrogenase
MTDYRAPTRDMLFVLSHVVDLEGIRKIETFSHAETDIVTGALEEAGRFMAEQIAPLARPADEQGSVRNDDGSVTAPDGYVEAYRRLVDSGWLAAGFPEQWGGGGLPMTVTIAIMEMITSADMSFSLCPMLTYAAADMLIAHGTEEQRATYLEKLVSGEWAGTMALTEAQAGSDVGAVTTRAVPADDGSYRLTGNKIYITWGEHDLTPNIVHLVLARTPGAAPGTRGISCFLVPKFLIEEDGSLGARNDITCVSIEHKLGIKASPTCVLSFGDADGAVGYLIGEEQQGMRYMFTMMNNARLNVGVEGLAIAERSYQQAVDYALERRQGRAVGAPKGEQSPIVEHPDVRRMLLLMKSQIEAMRYLTYKNAEAIDRSLHHPDPEERARGAELAAILTPISKAWCTDVAVEVTSIGLQVHGGMGYIEETGPAQWFRDARITPIYEGTNGIQAQDLAMRKLPLREGRAVAELLDEMRGVAAEVDDAGVLDAFAANLRDAVDALDAAGNHLLARLGEDPNDALAGATPYLEMFGITAGGWLSGVAALAALRALADGGEDGFLRSKVETARFYGDHILPRVRGLLATTTAGAAGMFSIPPEQLAR